MLFMKQCRYCRKLYPESYFGVALTTKDKVYRRHKCKFCYLETKKVRKNNHREWLKNLKLNSKCGRCGNNDYRVLEFHHLDGKNKDFSISLNYLNLGIEKIMQEIKKCDILCANCHRITHYEENGW